MYEIKSKKTGRTEVVSEDDLAKMKNILSRYVVTKLSLKPLIPSLKNPPLEIKKQKKI